MQTFLLLTYSIAAFFLPTAGIFTNLEGDYCFKKREKNVLTEVRLRILSDDDIRGEMTIQPNEDHGAVGSLTGQMISATEMKLIFDYTIEGSRQTEEKIMKIENNKLFIKVGELRDPKNDGNLIYKNAAKAQYKEVLGRIKCD